MESSSADHGTGLVSSGLDMGSGPGLDGSGAGAGEGAGEGREGRDGAASWRSFWWCTRGVI